MIENVKCPICGDTKVQRKDLNLAQCQGCLFTSPVGKFKWVDKSIETPIHANSKMIEHLPPPEIGEAHDIVCNYFKKRGHKKWAFGGLQARNEDVLNLTVDLPTVRKYAAGFRCAVVPAKSVADLQRYLEEMTRELRILGPGTTKDTVAEIEYQLRLIVETMHGRLGA